MQANSRIPESAWVVDDHPSEQAIQMLREHLREYNAAAANSRDGWRLALFLHEEQGRMIGGICGRFWGECLEIDTLWVEANWRGPRYQGRGYGRTGMAAVIAQIKTEPDAHKIAISYDGSNAVMARLCLSVGFQPTGRVIEDEIEACLTLR